MDFSQPELLCLIFFFVTVIWIAADAWFRSPIHIWSPPVLMCLLFGYYMFLGPIYFIIIKETVFLGVDFRPLYLGGWTASAVAFGAWLLGYYAWPAKVRALRSPGDFRMVSKFNKYLLLASFVAVLLWSTLVRSSASLFNPLASAQDADRYTVATTANPFLNYLLALVNISIPCMIMGLLVWLKSGSRIALIRLFVIGTLFYIFYINSGFRFRLLWATLGLVAAYHLWKSKRPNLLLMLGGTTLFISFMGLIGATRNYWAGLDLQRAAGMGFKDFLSSGFNEAGIFFSVCAVVDAIPRLVSHTLFDPIWVTITFPIPRRLWPGKPDSQTLDAMAASFGSEHAFSAGQAVPYFGEWYVAFGWLGLIVSSIILGILCRLFWRWYLENSRDIIALTTYATGLGFIYVVFSRGYLPQQAMNFCFTLLPFFIFHFYQQARISRSHFNRRLVEGKRGRMMKGGMW